MNSSTIHFSSITDSVLNKDVREIEVISGNEHNKITSITRDRLGANVDDGSFNTWVLVIGENSFTYTRDTTVFHLCASYLLRNENKVFIFEFETLRNVIKYINDYHAGIDYGIDEI